MATSHILLDTPKRGAYLRSTEEFFLENDMEFNLKDVW